MSNYISEMNEQEPLGADPIPHDSTPLSSAEVRRLRRIEEAAREFLSLARLRGQGHQRGLSALADALESDSTSEGNQ